MGYTKRLLERLEREDGPGWLAPIREPLKCPGGCPLIPVQPNILVCADPTCPNKCTERLAAGETFRDVSQKPLL